MRYLSKCVENVRPFVPGLLVAVTVLAVGLAAYEGLEAYRWKKSVDLRGYYGAMAAGWLSGPTGVTLPNGKEVNRISLLDGLLQQAVAQAVKDGKLKTKE